MRSLSIAFHTFHRSSIKQSQKYRNKQLDWFRAAGVSSKVFWAFVVRCDSIMSSTPKWYCRGKGQAPQSFAEISKLGNELRRITKRIVIDVKVDVFSEQDTILEDCERVVTLYWQMKDASQQGDFSSLSKKYKRSPYNTLVQYKYNRLVELNDQRFCQLTFVLKCTLNDLLRKATQSEVWLNWALQIAELYNKCRSGYSGGERLGAAQQEQKVNGNGKDKEGSEHESEMNANICSNMYPALLLPLKPPIDFAYVLQLVSQTRVEQNSLDLLFGLFNMGEQDAWRSDENYGDSNCSSLEILRILTLNITGDGEFQQYYEQPAKDYNALQQYTDANGDVQTDENEAFNICLNQTQPGRHTEQFLQRERAFIAQLIAQASEICPTIFGDVNKMDVNAYIVRGMRLIWSYVGIVLDHIILWWIDTPISCYSLTHVDSIRHWLCMQDENDIPEPVFSTLRGIGEILTNFVCNNIWDQLFRLTLISTSSDKTRIENLVSQYRGSPKNQFGTSTGTVWIAVFANLINLSNTYFPHDEVHSSNILPVAEQIPILHRIDHSVHSMRIWITEQAKKLCSEWRMDRFFQILEHDDQICQELFVVLNLPKLTADQSDILYLVCVALRTKLICEVNVNIDKLKKTTEECVHILSSVCRTLSLANFTLCFPSAKYWQRSIYDEAPKNDYVIHVLNQIFLPTIKATHDIVILKLVLKIICEAWLDYIYQKRIKFSVEGAVCLLHDFDRVSEWILNCSLLEEDYVEKLSNHDVLRMCKGVGKILLRKPEDVIAITQTPKYDKKSDDAVGQDTQLPSEMFVSNQKHWLELRARNSKIPCFRLCCGDAAL